MSATHILQISDFRLRKSMLLSLVPLVDKLAAHDRPALIFIKAVIGDRPGRLDRQSQEGSAGKAIPALQRPAVASSRPASSQRRRPIPWGRFPGEGRALRARPPGIT